MSDSQQTGVNGNHAHIEGGIHFYPPSDPPTDKPLHFRLWTISFSLLIIILSTIGGLIGGVFWTSIWRPQGGTIGGSIEPHGTDAFLWAFFTNIISFIMVGISTWLYNNKFKKFIPNYHDKRNAGVDIGVDIGIDIFIVLIVISIASWIFYDFSFFGEKGFRNTIYEFHWSFWKKEAVIVVIWIILLFLGLFTPLAIRKIYFKGTNTKEIILLFFIQFAFVVLLTSFGVIYFITFYQGVQFQDARGIIAAMLLRFGLSLSLVINWIEWLLNK
jgi:hypothetical protein